MTTLFGDNIQALHEETGGFSGLTKHLEPSVIQEVLERNGSVTVRRRRLPQEMVIWLVVGMALFRNKSLRQVAEALALCINGVPAASSLCEARDRLKPAVMRDLTTTLGASWGKQVEGHTWRGLRTFGLDGTVLNVFDSEGNEIYFGKPGSSRDKDSAAYPQVRFVGLMELSSKIIVDGEVTPLACGENTAAQPLLERICDNSVTILDRGFQSVVNFFKLFDAQKDKHFICRMKSNLRPRFVKMLRGSSYLAVLTLSKKQREENPTLQSELLVRVIEYQIEGTAQPIKLITSLTDEDAFPALEVAQLYHLRWEYELGLRDLKTTLLDPKLVLRSKSPEKVVQELWAILLAYNLIRREMVVAAAKHGEHPSRISFTAAMQQIHAFFISHTSSLAAPAKLPAAIAALHETLWVFCLPKRRTGRSCPRWVKRKQPSKFPKKPPRAASWTSVG